MRRYGGRFFGCAGRQFFDLGIEVADVEAVLDGTVFLELAFGVGLGDFGGDFASILQDFPVSGGNEAVQAGFPVLHGHGDLPQGHIFGHVEVGGNEALQLGHFVFCQVVFCYADIEFLDFAFWRILPGGEAHAVFRGIGSVEDDFRRRLAVDGPVEFVLHGGKETLGGLGGDVVVNRSGVDVSDFLVKLALAQADFPDALQLLFEILFGENGAGIFQALIIHREAFDGERFNDAGGPLAELHGAFGVDLVADGDDGGEVVVLGVVGFAVGGSYSKISNN